MSNIAIIVAIVPPKELVDLSVKINSESRKKGFHADELGINDFFPHITLFMGIVKKKDLANIVLILRKLFLKKRSFKLEIIGIEDSSHRPEENSHLKIKNTKELQKIHNDVCENLSVYLQSIASEDSLFENKEISDNTKKWLENYVLLSAYEKYNPHITLRCKNSRPQGLSAKFEVNEIAIFYVGNHCTCRKKLWGLEFK